MSRPSSLFVLLAPIAACRGAPPPAELAAAPAPAIAPAPVATPAQTPATASDDPAAPPATSPSPQRIDHLAKIEPITELTPDVILARIMSSYMPGLKACHRMSLERSPENKGTVGLAFAVMPDGRVTDATATGFEPELDRCIEGQMVAWRFAHSAPAAKPHPFTITLSMKPD